MEIEEKTYAELSRDELYAILALRTEIFVVEQQCAYPETDFYDQQSVHLLGRENGELLAYARVVVPAAADEDLSIGRVAVRKRVRGKNYGRKIFEEAMRSAAARYPGKDIKIQAQVYLEDFYRSCGFVTRTEPYPDYGVWHVDMIWENENYSS